MLKLAVQLAAFNKSQSELARHLRISAGAMNQAVLHDHWPKRAGGGEQVLRHRIRSWLADLGATPEMLAATFEECAGLRGNATPLTEANASTPSPQAQQPKDEEMLLRKHTITADAREHFALARDPFTNEMRGVADVYLNDNLRKARAAVRNTAQHGGMLAIIAESGAGKSTLRKDLAHWIKSADQPVILVEPYILGMEDHERRGRPLRAEDILAAVIRRVSPGTPMRQSHQARSAQVHDILRASAQAGNRHVLIIEEAHRLARQTIRHFKGFYELDDGFTSLLSIVLVGQTELDWKLGDNDFEVREVVQRMEKRYLQPLDNDIEAYLRFKFGRIDADYAKLFEPDVPEAVLTRLRVSHETRVRGQRTLGPRSLCYPLAINNLISAAINLAHLAGEDKVSARIVAQVGKAELS
jgi:type II secretory pathway predicted ATPase ExeA